MNIIKVGNPNRLVKHARENQWKYMFNLKTGELSESDDKLVNDYDSSWFWINDTVYPVYDKEKYIGSYWEGVFEEVNPE